MKISNNIHYTSRKCEVVETIKQGTCKFKIIKDVSKKSGNEYKAIKLVFGDYELSTPLFLNDDQLFVINDRLEKINNSL